MSIVVIGTVFVDIKGHPEDVYLHGGRNAGRVEQVHGGVGRNVAEDIANVGRDCTFVGLVDESALGAELATRLSARGVNTEYLRATPDGMGLWLAVFDEGGDVVASIAKRPNLTAICEILDKHGNEIFADAESIVLEIDMDADVSEKVLDLASVHHKRVVALVANMSIATERRDLLSRADVLICNAQEAGILFSAETETLSPAELEECVASRRAELGVSTLVVTMGEQGAVYASEGERGHCPAERVCVKDTTGAGDAFCAGLTIGLTEGNPLPASCAFGARLSAAVIVTGENVCPVSTRLS